MMAKKKIEANGISEISKVFGNLVKKTRKDKGLSQEEFASITGIRREKISEIESGKHQFNYYWEQLLSRHLPLTFGIEFDKGEIKLWVVYETKKEEIK